MSSNSLDPGQQRVARILYGIGIRAGLAPPRAREFVAAAYAESSLRPGAVNKRSGAAGLYQLLSSGYRQRAQKLGGLFNPVANARAILPDYLSYWHSHPSALPGAAGAGVERSGEGAGFYANPLRLLGGLTGAGAPVAQPALSGPAPSPPPPGAGPLAGPLPLGGAPGPPAPLTIAPPDRRSLAMLFAGSFGSHGGIDAGALAGGLAQINHQRVEAALTAHAQNAISAPASPTIGPRGVSGAPVAPRTLHAVPVPSHMGAVRLLPGADRAGVTTKRAVILFVRKIAGIYGKPLTIGTGSNHHEFVAGEPGVRSDHWFGEAADIPASGAQLTQLGQAALIAAGMPPAEARKQHGGVFNINGYNILFNTRVGGNHFNHLHVGLGRILGRPR